MRNNLANAKIKCKKLPLKIEVHKNGSNQDFFLKKEHKYNKEKKNILLKQTKTTQMLSPNHCNQTQEEEEKQEPTEYITIYKNLALLFFVALFHILNFYQYVQYAFSTTELVRFLFPQLLMLWASRENVRTVCLQHIEPATGTFTLHDSLKPRNSHREAIWICLWLQYELTISYRVPWSYADRRLIATLCFSAVANWKKFQTRKDNKQLKNMHPEKKTKTEEKTATTPRKRRE